MIGTIVKFKELEINCSSLNLYKLQRILLYFKIVLETISRKVAYFSIRVDSLKKKKKKKYQGVTPFLPL